jgi:hypothetical protein
MQEFNHERTIRLVCVRKKNFWPFSLLRKNSGDLQIESLQMDKEIKSLFRRNGIPTKKNRKMHPNTLLRLMLEFLGKNKLDGGISEQFFDNGYVAIITIKKRPRFSHSG